VSTLSFDYFLDNAINPEIDRWLRKLAPTINTLTQPQRHGDLQRWVTALKSIPSIHTDIVQLDTPAVTTWSNDQCASLTDTIRQSLQALRPWRKGPFNLNGVYIDSEWCSNSKWSRLKPHLDLRGDNILDVGCGNGYYALRMLGDGAESVIGVDPNLLFCTQFQAVNQFVKQDRACVLPLAIEHLENTNCHFDKVFSMGVLYHRREPVNHLKWLRRFLHEDSALVLETLVIDSHEVSEIIPQNRYANMRNVWSLPSVPLLLKQLKSAGYNRVKCVDLTRTRIDEQRQTEWMTFHSLEHALDPDNHNLTIEGYPSPLRAVVIAQK